MDWGTASQRLAGKGVPQDYAEAASRQRKAADGRAIYDSRVAQYRMGLMYAR
jgi:hypothetical protein